MQVLLKPELAVVMPPHTRHNTKKLPARYFMPACTSARVHANTVNGRINTEFHLPVRGQFVSKRADGAIGHGGPDLRIATVNGSIILRRSRNSDHTKI